MEMALAVSLIDEPGDPISTSDKAEDRRRFMVDIQRLEGLQGHAVANSGLVRSVGRFRRQHEISIWPSSRDARTNAKTGVSTRGISQVDTSNATVDAKNTGSLANR
jgi:hypothetical protein